MKISIVCMIVALHILVGCGLSLATTEKELFDAARKGDVAALKKILQEDPSIINKPDKDGNSALMKAVDAAKLDSVKVLLTAGADIAFRDKKGKTVVERALSDNIGELQPEILREFSKVGVDFNQILVNGEHPVVDAAQRILSVQAKALLDAGADPNAKSKKGAPAIYVAVENNYIGEGVEIVRSLVNARANVNVRNEKGKSALEKAVDILDYRDEGARLQAGRMAYWLIRGGADEESTKKAVDICIKSGYPELLDAIYTAQSDKAKKE